MAAKCSSGTMDHFSLFLSKSKCWFWKRGDKGAHTSVSCIYVWWRVYKIFHKLFSVLGSLVFASSSVTWQRSSYLAVCECSNSLGRHLPALQQHTSLQHTMLKCLHTTWHHIWHRHNKSLSHILNSSSVFSKVKYDLIRAQNIPLFSYRKVAHFFLNE